MREKHLPPIHTTTETTMTTQQLDNVGQLISYLHYDCEEVSSFISVHYDILEKGDVSTLWNQRHNKDSIFHNSIVLPLLELNESLGGETAVKVLEFLI